MKKTVLLAMVAISTVALSACSSTPDEDPEVVLQKAWEKLASQSLEQKSGEAVISAKGSGDFEGTDFSADVSLDINVDASESAEDPNVSMKVDLNGEGTLEGQSGKVSLAGELRSLGETSYFFLEDVGVDTGNPQNDSMVTFVSTLFKSKWFSIDSALLEGSGLTGNEINPEEYLRVFSQNQILTFKEDLGSRTYKVDLDPEAFANFMIESAKLQGEELPEEGIAFLKSSMAPEVIKAAGVSYDIRVTIDKEYNFSWIKLDFTMDTPDSEDKIDLLVEADMQGEPQNGSIEGTLELEVEGSESGSLTMSFSIDSKEKEVLVEAPENAEPFDPSLFLGGGLGAGLGGDDLMVNDLEGMMPPEAELGN